MSIWHWPFDLVPQRQAWTTVSRSALSPSPMTAYTQAVSRPGVFMRSDMTFSPDSRYRDRLDSFLSLVSDQTDRFYLPDFVNVSGGDLDRETILQNGNMASLTGWSDNNLNLALAGGWILARTNTTAQGLLYQSITSYAASGRYCVSFNLKTEGVQTVDVRIGTTVGGAEIANTAALTDGGHRICFTAPASGTWYVAWEGSASTAANMFWLSSALCVPSLRVNGASQTGRRLSVKDLAAHGGGGSAVALLPGDRVAVDTGGDNWEIKKLHLNLAGNLGTSPANDQGYAHFDPPLRISPANSADILLGCQAAALMRLAQPGYSRQDKPGFSGFEVQCVEAFQ